MPPNKCLVVQGFPLEAWSSSKKYKEICTFVPHTTYINRWKWIFPYHIMNKANFHIFMDLSTWPEWSLNCLISMKCVNCLLWCALQPPHFKPLDLLREILLHLIKTIIPFGTILLHPFSVLLEDLKNQCQTTFKLLWRNMLVFFFSLTCHLSVSCIL